MSPCRICSGRLELFLRGAGTAPDPAGFAPTCHQPGAHGDLYRCRECATVQQPSLPAGGALHDLYRRMRDAGYLKEERGRRRSARRLLDLLDAPSPGARLLEIGCGHGLLLDEARARGYEVHGLELSVDAAGHAREALGLDITEVALEDADLQGREFDAVVLADVIEHLHDPVRALARCKELLAPDGTLLLVTPDPSSLTARLAGARWWGYLPAHTCLIPRATLRGLLGDQGLVLEEDVSYVRSFTPAYWLDGLAQRGGAAGALLKAASRGLPDRTLLSLSLGDERVMVARKTNVTPARQRPLLDRGAPANVAP